jgi:predicted O-linked N-acetylglucosamine transferase (SPINDLY family)
VNYLGYPGTMGAAYIDYIIADEMVIPHDSRAQFSEKVVYLPDTFQPNDSKRRIADVVPTRAQEGLPEKGFVFCSFNNSSKILPATFDVWMRLLREIPDSVLWLPQYNPAEPRHLKREAAARGIAPERLVFAKLTATPEQYLARMALADLFLDTLPYNAHSTAVDALWAGVPVLTVQGTAFAGRVAASALNAIGMPELVTRSAGEYEATALRLARDPAALAGMRAKLKRNRDSCALFDTPRRCRDLESAYIRMWERWQRGEPPAHFAVAPV